MSSMYFFFQAEDGIRDGHVTGVQTCALPISLGRFTGRVGCACNAINPFLGRRPAPGNYTSARYTSMLLDELQSEAGKMDWAALRAEFPITRHWAFFDHAAVAPNTARAQQALAEWAMDMAENGDVREPRWTQRVEE